MSKDMPIPVDELKKNEGYVKLEVEISKFLEEHKGEAYSEKELHKKMYNIPPIKFSKDFILEDVGNLARVFVSSYSLSITLNKMVEKKRINVKNTKGTVYYYIE
ncbi:unnamed protein product [marine sediment metagenome]|uniref:Uncharacterized protein n=1 Tax=marine sediment metagenome TaxID=412755 RepID=X1Q2J5_9ZZZZ